MAKAETKKKATTVKAKKAVGKKSAVNNTATTSDYAILLQPLVTEKSSLLGVDNRRVVFNVPRGTDKTQIRRAVERVFNVEVSTVRTLNVMGKATRNARGQTGRKVSFKKAYVTLKEGFSINVVEGL